jgi:hypothetical protein
MRLTAQINADMQRNPSPALDLLLDIDQLTSAVWSGALQLDPLSVFLGVNGQMMLQAAIHMAASGHVAAIYPLLRAALESASYGFRTSKDPTLLQIWIDRENGEAQRKACRKAFTSAVADAAKEIAEVEPALGHYIQQLHERVLRMGRIRM